MNICDLPKHDYMHPVDIFRYMAEQLGVTDVEYKGSDDGSCSYTFYLYKGETPADFVEAVRMLSMYQQYVRGGKYGICQNMITYILTVRYVVSKTGNESLCLMYHDYTHSVTAREGKIVSVKTKQSTSAKFRFHVYDKGVVWNYTPKGYKKDNDEENGFVISGHDLPYGTYVISECDVSADNKTD